MNLHFHPNLRLICYTTENDFQYSMIQYGNERLRAVKNSIYNLLYNTHIDTAKNNLLNFWIK